MADTVPAAGGFRKVAVSNLTAGEKADLEAKGVDLSADFVDVDITAARSKVIDPAADDRRSFTAELQKLTAAANAAPPGTSATTATRPKSGMDALEASAEVEALNAKIKGLEADLAKRPTECPRCRWKTDAQVIAEPTKAQISNFLRSVLAGEPYEEEFSVFGDAAKVVFRTRYSCEDDAIRSTLRALVLARELVGGSDIEEAAANLRFLCALKSITVGSKCMIFNSVRDALEDPNYGKGNSLRVDMVLKKSTKDIPTQLLYALRAEFARFDYCVETMMTRASDPGFWSGTPASG